MTLKIIFQKLTLLLVLLQWGHYALAQKKFGEAMKSELPEVTQEREKWRQRRKEDSLSFLHPYIIKQTTSEHSRRRLNVRFQQVAEEHAPIVQQLGFGYLRIELYLEDTHQTKIRIIAVAPLLRKLERKQIRAAT
jgi:hypothetical protein